MEELYNEIVKQIPNPYYPNELYRVYSDKFSSLSLYFATKNNRGFLHIYKLSMHTNWIQLERFRFTKQKELKYMNEYFITKKDEELYKKYLDIYNKAVI